MGNIYFEIVENADKQNFLNNLAYKVNELRNPQYDIQQYEVLSILYSTGNGLYSALIEYKK